eukprot:CAMPEP_0202958490 /NCGR_PEP_ID=MMETSP1396-20130829/2829_1 /ASSEMBLY_ACC=CAM_ASM_000872 /TAXON_ID= /ORGANISM="Pseudokeronopsis sp., Strain Brazil" /LENGTH=72 /DNA_ID=CAMNT_0049676599 /DNA_START=263 /DNA_END=481 /DNA_ORIENTATION=+
MDLLIEIDSDNSNGHVIDWKSGASFFKSNSGSVCDRVYLMARKLSESKDWNDHTLKGKLNKSLDEVDILRIA